MAREAERQLPLHAARVLQCCDSCCRYFHASAHASYGSEGIAVTVQPA